MVRIIVEGPELDAVASVLESDVAARITDHAPRVHDPIKIDGGDIESERRFEQARAVTLGLVGDRRHLVVADVRAQCRDKLSDLPT
jgi:hypothetical protein